MKLIKYEHFKMRKVQNQILNSLFIEELFIMF
jgi:hypothetical protein